MKKKESNVFTRECKVYIQSVCIAIVGILIGIIIYYIEPTKSSSDVIENIICTMVFLVVFIIACNNLSK